MKKLNLTIEVRAACSASLSVPDDMDLNTAIAFAKENMSALDVSSSAQFIPGSEEILEQHCCFEEIKEAQEAPYRYVLINPQTETASENPFFVYFCMDNNCAQFKADTEMCGLVTKELVMGGTKAVIAVDALHDVDLDVIQNEILHADAVKDMDGPFPEQRYFHFPVFYEMWARQALLAKNLKCAMTEIFHAPLPKNANYVDESFQVDNESFITVE